MTFKTLLAGVAIAALTTTATIAPAGGLADDVAEQETIVSTQGGAGAGISTWLIPTLVITMIVIAEANSDDGKPKLKPVPDDWEPIITDCTNDLTIC